MGMTRTIGWLGFVVLAMFGFAVHGAELPTSDFVQNPLLQDPVISPDGRDLAVVVPKNGDSTDARRDRYPQAAGPDADQPAGHAPDVAAHANRVGQQPPPGRFVRAGLPGSA